jgi:tetratricopeptide (TPR) repeat protein
MKHEFEQLLRSGRRVEVERQLLSMNLSKVPREGALTLANVASRINRHDIALRILNPIVRDQKPDQGQAKPEELLEYANCLRKLGAIDEAVSILKGIDAKRFPQVNFYLALSCFAKWQYDQALPYLRSYLQGLEPGSYSLKVAQVNFASALISTGAYDEASDLLERLYTQLKETESRVLCANSLELKSQIEILHRKNYKLALANLAEARHWLGDDVGNIANLFVRKWEAVALSLDEKRVSKRLLQVRDDALHLRHWETARDCEYFLAELRGDSEQLLKLYFGTPYDSFREKIRERNPNLIVPDTYMWGSKEGPVFDLRTADGDGSQLSAGQMSHRLLILLAKDFFKPVSLMAMFSAIFPDEYYSPFTTPNRIHQLVRQLRMQIQEAKLPIAIEQAEGSYRISMPEPLRICVPRDGLPLDGHELNWIRLQIKLKSQEFTNKDAVSALDSSRASVQRLLQWAVENGKVVMISAGRSAKFKAVS